MMRTTLIRVAVGFSLLLGVAAGPVKAGFIYNNAADFSATNNPNGVWSYGDLNPGSTPDASSFSLYTENGTTGGIEFVDNTGVFQPQYVSYNPTNSTIDYGTATYAAGQAGFHPGPNGEYSVFRFTTPYTGSYSLSALFTSIDNHGGDSKGIYVLDNGSSLFSSTLSGSYGSTGSYSTTLNLSAGDEIDFVLGNGGNPYYYDSTALDATLTLTSSPVPEPAGITLLVTGAFSFFASSWLKSLAGYRSFQKGNMQ